MIEGGTRDTAAIPVLFVFIWATGFIVARLVAPHTEPFTFLAIRVTLAAFVFSCVSALVGARWPLTARAWVNALIAGVLLQGVYLGGVFWSTRHGLPAALAALIGGLQPVLTAALAPWLLGERVEHDVAPAPVQLRERAEVVLPAALLEVRRHEALRHR